MRLKTLGQQVAPATAPRGGGWSAPQRGSRQQRGYGSQWDRIRPRILARDKWLCQVCLRAGRISAGNIVDHVVPKFQGGTDDECNLQTICGGCHRLKTQMESQQAMGGYREF